MIDYAYHCPYCHHTFDRQYPMGEQPKRAKCPKCKRRAASLRVTGGNGFVLKGSGWTPRGNG